MCNCISEVDKTLADKYDDPDASVCVGFTFKNGSLDTRPSGLEARYHARKKDGTYSYRESKVSIVPVYCPFCGRKYEE